MTAMPSGDWCKGKTKDSDPRVSQMAENVQKSLNDPELRRRLDEKKKLTPEKIIEKIETSGSRWTLVSGVQDYKNQGSKVLLCKCPSGHETFLSLMNVIQNNRCLTCSPVKNAGTSNGSFVPVEQFIDRLLTSHGVDAFAYDPTQYQGLTFPIEFSCSICETSFKKRPKDVLLEKHACPKCSSKHRGDRQRRTNEEFFKLANEVHGTRFIFHPKEEQKYGNLDTILRTCTICNVSEEQSVPSLLVGNSCSTCSQKKKHTTESFIEIAKTVFEEDKFDYSQVVYVNNKVPVTIKCSKGHTFKCAPSNHFNGKGCPDCAMKRYISAGETEWLNSLAIPVENRNVWINVKGQRFNADALINATIYEYYGDYWHGNLTRFKPELINHKSKMTMQEHHDHTLEREDILREAGYVVVTMWESDWMKLRETRRRPRS